ncbi:MAG: hypothetical protein AAF234_08095 [Pseudomonadota bacterium]
MTKTRRSARDVSDEQQDRDWRAYWFSGCDGQVQLDLGFETTITLHGGHMPTAEPDSDANAALGADGSNDTHDFEAGAAIS